jgi:predicted dehydrogenase
MIRVAIVGCGKIADQHVAQIRRIAGAEIVGVCDLEPIMARQLHERVGTGGCFTDVAEMIRSTRPDVVHVTTPPQSHFDLGRLVLRSGCHAYIEKPFTLTAAEAEELIALATRAGLKITAGHNALFTHAMVDMRRLVGAGFLGGLPTHIESMYCYELGPDPHSSGLLGAGGHWVRNLPGSLLQNIISHGVAKIAEFLTDDHPVVLAHGFTSPVLRRAGEKELLDEARVIIADRHGATTAYFTFSTSIRPVPHQLRLYGPQRSLIVDDDHQTLIRLDNRDYKSYYRYFIPPAGFAMQHLKYLARNVARFVRNDFHMPFDAGLKRLIQAFYDSILSDAPLPIPYRDIILTARIMDSIFAQIAESARHEGAPAQVLVRA